MIFNAFHGKRDFFFRRFAVFGIASWHLKGTEVAKDLCRKRIFTETEIQGEYQFSVQTKNKVNNKWYSIVSWLKFKFNDVLTFSIVLEITLSYFKRNL
jgi:hypothetical protein